jgi:hypothetical protein
MLTAKGCAGFRRRRLIAARGGIWNVLPRRRESAPTVKGHFLVPWKDYVIFGARKFSQIYFWRDRGFSKGCARKNLEIESSSIWFIPKSRFERQKQPYHKFHFSERSCYPGIAACRLSPPGGALPATRSAWVENVA